MKLSIVSSLKETKSSPDAVNSNFEALCDFLQPLGYDGVELSILEPERINAKKINEIKDSYEMEISALGTGGTFIRFGYSLGHHEEQMRIKAIKRIDKYIDFAHEVGAKVIIGLIRGRYNFENNPKREKVNIKSSLKQCCQIAENKDVELVFEPINQFEIDSYNTISEALELLKEINSTHLNLLIDTFHIHLEEDPGIIWDYLGEIVDHVSHIHLADCTRRAPGSGHFDFKTFIEIFQDAGYKDFISAETIMKPSFEDVAQETAEVINLILKKKIERN